MKPKFNAGNRVITKHGRAVILTVILNPFPQKFSYQVALDDNRVLEIMELGLALEV